MKLLLHTCCAPCMLAPMQALREEGFDVLPFFFNPNIHPLLEFRKRLKAFRVCEHAGKMEAMIDDEYGLRSFLQTVDWQAPARQRCASCYRMRLAETARRAEAHGVGAISTTLLVSPHQQHDVIRKTAGEVAAEHGVEFIYRDFRKLFERTEEMARRRRLYRQQYCGCVFSEYERYANTTREIWKSDAARTSRRKAEADE